ncbi:hypothetical protein BC828DRAFT_372587 [Blastocladiella britannica]|nr:hypothetical protein BC828DRAFT_372587 [Blastocladiella britannica]
MISGLCVLLALCAGHAAGQMTSSESVTSQFTPVFIITGCLIVVVLILFISYNNFVKEQSHQLRLAAAAAVKRVRSSWRASSMYLPTQKPRTAPAVPEVIINNQSNKGRESSMYLPTTMAAAAARPVSIEDEDRFSRILPTSPRPMIATPPPRPPRAVTEEFDALSRPSRPRLGGGDQQHVQADTTTAAAAVPLPEHIRKWPARRTASIHAKDPPAAADRRGVPMRPAAAAVAMRQVSGGSAPVPRTPMTTTTLGATDLSLPPSRTKSLYSPVSTPTADPSPIAELSDFLDRMGTPEMVVPAEEEPRAIAGATAPTVQQPMPQQPEPVAAAASVETTVVIKDDLSAPQAPATAPTAQKKVTATRQPSLGLGEDAYLSFALMEALATPLPPPSGKSTLGGADGDEVSEVSEVSSSHPASAIQAPPPPLVTISAPAQSAAAPSSDDLATSKVNKRLTSLGALKLPPQLVAPRLYPITFHGAQPQVDELFKAIAQYQPQQDDELDLHPGDQVVVTAEFDDGWAMGQNLTRGSGMPGLFPLSALHRPISRALSPTITTGEENGVVDQDQSWRASRPVSHVSTLSRNIDDVLSAYFTTTTGEEDTDSHPLPVESLDRAVASIWSTLAAPAPHAAQD